VTRFCALKEPDVFLQHRLYRWDITEPVSGTWEVRPCQVAFACRLLIPTSIFRLHTAFPGCEWAIEARLEFVLGDWYSQDDLRKYVTLAQHPAIGNATGREVVSCSTTFGGSDVVHKVHIGERLNIHVQEIYAHADIVAGRVVPLLLYTAQEA
jgi:hypothetical protein